METLHFSTKDFAPWTVGFDPLFRQLHEVHEQLGKTVPGYPPYNIEQTGENTYAIEMAVAGFGKTDIEIVTEGDTLKISGKVDNKETDDERGFLHKGISNKAFTRHFTLADQVEVKNAEMFNGLLKVFLEHVIPEDKKPRTVEVKDVKK